MIRTTQDQKIENIKYFSKVETTGAALNDALGHRGSPLERKRSEEFRCLFVELTVRG